MNAKNSRPRMRYFSNEQVKKIYTNAVELLETHGFMVDTRANASKCYMLHNIHGTG